MQGSDACTPRGPGTATNLGVLVERESSQIVGFSGLMPCSVLGSQDFEIGFVLWIASLYLLCVAVIENDRELAAHALERVAAPKTSRFFPESEREALLTLAAPLGLAKRARSG